MPAVTATGVRILEGLEAEATRRGTQKLVLNARDNATEFYAELEYVVVGEAETLFGKIHRVQMAKCYYNGSYITAYISNYALIVNALAFVLMRIPSR